MDSSNDAEYDDVMSSVDDAVQGIINLKARIDGNKHGIRFSAREIRFALTLYNRSPAGYRDVCVYKMKLGNLFLI